MAAAMHAPHGPSEQENVAQALQTEACTAYQKSNLLS